ICIGQIAVQNQGRLPSIFEVYKNRSQLESRVAQVQEVIERTVPAGAIVLMCERDIPLSGGLELRRLPASECLLRDPVPALKPGEWLLLTDEQRKRARTIAPSSDPNLAASLSIPRSNRDGFWDTEQMYVYRIP
ncbi:MAG: hypothetical protein KDK37_17265, partial [Leptospiraceae bacterium]|nr:hypothetical protein [Leptospiraceae bacterium]